VGDFGFTQWGMMLLPYVVVANEARAPESVLADLGDAEWVHRFRSADGKRRRRASGAS
jgi:hypothetical protein